MALIYNATFDKTTRKLSFEDKAGNEIYSFIVPERAPVDDLTKPLTFKATQDSSTVTLTRHGIPKGADFQTSRDGGNTWTDYSINTAITLNTGDEVSFRVKADRTEAQNAGHYFYFMMEGKIEAWHNVMSLYRTNDFATYNTTPWTDTFISLFSNCTSLTKAPVLPATTITDSCYYHMFYGCTSLTKAPVLPATTLDRYCYSGMFYGCTSLTRAPELPATTLGIKCYESMFYGCTSLTEAPELTATTLANYCYESMFYGCTSLTEAPELPATTLANDCYSSMFHSCTSLVNAPVLPATTLAGSCYESMFHSCRSLVNAPVLPATTLAERCYQYMFSGCTSLVNAPELRATTLDDYCYSSMFKGCTSLTQAPELTATALARFCYEYMFSGCTSLVNAPVLPATTLANDCYDYMFDGCTSLTEAPALPATTLSISCYYYMFNGCTSLTRAPELTATTLAQYCYQYMFKNCSSLNEVRCKMPSSYSSSQISSYAKDWLYNVSSTGTFYTNADANWPSGASGIPTGWTRVNESAPTVDDITKPLTFKATQDGSTVKLKKEKLNTSVEFYVSFQTSRDGGNTWVDYTLDSAIRLNTGDEVSFRTLYDRTSSQALQSASKYTCFTMTGKIEAWHNVMSLYRTNDFATYNYVSSHCFYQLFASCTSLTKAPALPATRLNDSCYSTMFAGCTSLKEAPELPATSCYNNCYQNMFAGCTSLTKAPALPATTLSDRCYWQMFSGCSSLNEVRCKMPSSYSAEDIPKYTGSGMYDAWLDGVSSTGTFYTNADANWPSGTGGIPTGWTRVNT